MGQFFIVLLSPTDTGNNLYTPANAKLRTKSLEWATINQLIPRFFFTITILIESNLFHLPFSPPVSYVSISSDWIPRTSHVRENGWFGIPTRPLRSLLVKLSVSNCATGGRNPVLTSYLTRVFSLRNTRAFVIRVDNIFFSFSPTKNGIS